MSEFRVLVCGGRHYSHFDRVNAALNLIWRETEGMLVVIEGGATGADQAAKEWAEDYESFDVEYEEFPAKWQENGHYNAGAGFERNTLMLKEGKPNLTIHFPGKNGTRDMVKKSQAADVPTINGEDLDAVREAILASAPRR